MAACFIHFLKGLFLWPRAVLLNGSLFDSQLIVSRVCLYRAVLTAVCYRCCQVMRDTQGSDLPRFTSEESQLLRDNVIDFFSVNFYCGYYVWAPAADAPKNKVRQAACSCAFMTAW